MPTATKLNAAPPASAILPLVLVFLCGVTVGAMVMRVWIHRVPSAVENPMQRTVERWKKQLDLTPAQTVQLESILDDFSKYYDNVLADGNTRVLQILDDRQKQKYQQMIKSHQH